MKRNCCFVVKLSLQLSGSGYSVDYPEEGAEGFQVAVFVGEDRATRP